MFKSSDTVAVSLLKISELHIIYKDIEDYISFITAKTNPLIITIKKAII